MGGRALPSFINSATNVIEVLNLLLPFPVISSFFVLFSSAISLSTRLLILQGFFNALHIIPSRKKHVTILKDVSGVIKPRRMTLLLGPPSSGKTTLLLALSGKLDKSLQVNHISLLLYILTERKKERNTNMIPMCYSGIWKSDLQRTRTERVCTPENRCLHQPARCSHWRNDCEGNLGFLRKVPRGWITLWLVSLCLPSLTNLYKI